jgi:hypothetical protein
MVSRSGNLKSAAEQPEPCIDRQALGGRHPFLEAAPAHESLAQHSRGDDLDPIIEQRVSSENKESGACTSLWRFEHERTASIRDAAQLSCPLAILRTLPCDRSLDEQSFRERTRVTGCTVGQ